MSAMVVARVPLLLLVLLTAVSSEDCPLPMEDDVRDGFNDILEDHFRTEGDHPPADITLYQYNFNCLAAGSIRDTYRSVAVTGLLFDLGPENVTMQIDLICLQGSIWFADSFLVGSLFSAQTNVTELLIAPPSTNCASCMWMPGMILPTLCTGKRVDCTFVRQLHLIHTLLCTRIECDPSCSQGLMYCTDEGANDCCGFYEDNVCVAECPENSIADADFNCGERLAQHFIIFQTSAH